MDEVPLQQNSANYRVGGTSSSRAKRPRSANIRAGKRVRKSSRWTFIARIAAQLVGVPGANLLKSEILKDKLVTRIGRSALFRILGIALAGLFGTILFGAALVLLLILIAVGFSYSPSADAGLMDKRAVVTRGIAHMTMPALVDNEGVFVGTPAPALFPNRPDRALAVRLSRASTPEGYARVIRALEHDSLNTFRTNIYGADWVSTTLAALSMGSRGGASGMPQQLTRVALDLRSENETPWQTLLRKLKEASYGAAYVVNLRRNAPENWIQDLVSDYASIQPIAARPEIAGLYAGSATLFGVEPMKLNDAQGAILAATAQRPLVFRKRDDGRLGLRPEAERRLRARAKAGLHKAFSNDSSRLSAAIADLENLPPISPREIQGVGQKEADPARLVQPAQRAVALAGTEVKLALAEMGELAGEIPKIQLTSAVRENLAFKRDFERRLSGLQAQGTLGVALLPNRSSRAPADVVAVEVSPEGGIRRIYSNTDFLPLDRRIEIASIGKIIASLALPGKCTDRPSSYAWVFGRSDPKALEPLLRRCASRTELVALLKAFNFRSEIPDVYRAISYGMIESTPRDVLAAYLALGDRLRGGDGTVSKPHIVYNLAQINSSRRGFDNIQLSRRLANGDRISSAKEVLRAAALPGGTLSGLAEICPNIAIAKTGTVGDGQSTGNRARYAAGAFDDGRAFFISVSARDGGLIGNLSGTDLIQLIQPLCERKTDAQHS